VGVPPVEIGFLSFGTALPQVRVEPPEILEAAAKFWPRHSNVLKAGIDEAPTRYLVSDLEEVTAPRTLSQRMATYAHHAPKLMKEAVCEALEAAELHPNQIDLVISVSCTGYLAPSLDAMLANDIGMRPDVIRMPLTELGCSGAAAGIGFARRHLLAHPHDRVLVAAVELCSTTWQHDDRSMDNLIAGLIFGDGAAAAVLSAVQERTSELRVEAAGSYLFPNTTSYLGFDLRDGGFHVVLGRRLPRLIEQNLEPAVSSFKQSAGVGPVDFMAVHGGGPRILEAVETALGVDAGTFEHSRRVYRQVGNVSSASILFVLKDLMSGISTAPQEGLGIAFGPGLSVELLHLRRCPAA
jgi:alkylresorcinol/alkylpyrone synthase